VEGCWIEGEVKVCVCTTKIGRLKSDIPSIYERGKIELRKRCATVLEFFDFSLFLLACDLPGMPKQRN